jgi:hypothetical protein
VPLLVRAADAALAPAGPRVEPHARAGGAALIGFAVACLSGSHFRFPDLAILAALAGALLPAPAAEDEEQAPAVSRRVPVIVAASGILASLLVLWPTRRAEAAFRAGPWLGAYPWEVHDTRMKRWMGPRALRRLWPEERSVAFLLTNQRPDGKAVLVSADVDGRPPLLLTIPPGEGRELKVEDIPRGAETLRLRFSPTFVPYRLDGARDFRELSVLLGWDLGEIPRSPR